MLGLWDGYDILSFYYTAIPQPWRDGPRALIFQGPAGDFGWDAIAGF
jgi:hypothetical protein